MGKDTDNATMMNDSKFLADLWPHQEGELQNLLPAIVAQVGDQGKGQGNGRNQNGNAVNDNIRGDVSRGCTYKEFLACNPKKYDGKGGAIVNTHYLEKMESVQDMSGCRDSLKVKYTTGSFVGKALTWWNSQIHTRGREAVVGFMSWLGMVGATEPKTIQKAVQIAGTFPNEALRNESIKKNPEKRGNRGEPSKDRNVRDDNKRTRTGNVFATTTNPVWRENTSMLPKCSICNTHHPPRASCRTCFNCNGPGHFTNNRRVMPRNVNPINARNPVARACYECGSTDHIKSSCLRLNQAQRPGARGRVFMLGAKEARQDPNIMTGMFTLNDHYATTLFDSGADYSFVSTIFIPLLGIEPNDLDFSYEIEIASGQLVEIDKVISGSKLAIEGHVFYINLIPFKSGSFDVIIGMDWLSDHKAEIIYDEKVVRIPLLDGNVLRVLGEKPKEKIIMVNVIPLDHMDDVPVVEPNQHDDVPVDPELVLVDEDEDPEEDEFEEEEDPQEEEDDMEVDIEEDENKPESTYPYEEMDSLNPSSPASESEPDDEIEVEDAVEPEIETVPVSVYEAHALVEKKGKAKDKFYGKLILDLGNEVRSSVEQGTTAMEKLVERLGNTKDKVECKKLKKELKEAWLSNTFLRMQNERVERDLYWTRVRAHEFYQEMIRRGFMFEERPNEAINVPIEDEKSPLSESRESSHDA
ncbi:putative reverse transcriptase domain-containing protein [Tanacetum coccineum]|uniref:Reverse transcriptase domain-containing protein n=1 Tax=Tanacetum coccineum TaxID=301880 RepID=A0ABQ5GBE9_9ASTR